MSKLQPAATEARYPSGKGEVCKTFMRRFDSDPRLHHFNYFRNRRKNSPAVRAATGSTAAFFSLDLGKRYR